MDKPQPSDLAYVDAEIAKASAFNGEIVVFACRINASVTTRRDREAIEAHYRAAGWTVSRQYIYRSGQRVTGLILRRSAGGEG